MNIKDLTEFPRDNLNAMLMSVPFYKTVKQQSTGQYELLLEHSRIVDLSPGELLLEQGRTDSWLYFLLKGQLSVVCEGVDGSKSLVNFITPGEVFGDLAVLLGLPRSANVSADLDCRSTVVFGTDFTVFGDLGDFRRISLETKLCYYRNMVHNLRWKLDVYRVSYPEAEHANDHRKIKLYFGSKDCEQELFHLEDQAKELCTVLFKWNDEFERIAIRDNNEINIESFQKINR